MKKLILSAFVCCLIFSTAVRADDWPNWRGPSKNGISSETKWSHDWPESGPKILWRANVGIGFSSFAVVDGRVYTMGNTGSKANKKKENQNDVIYCFNAKTGDVIWKHKSKEALWPRYYEGGTSATPTIHNGKVYTLSKTGVVLCMNAKDGAVVWERDLVKEHKFKIPSWGFAGSVLVYKDNLVLNVGTHGIAIKAKDGSLVWSTGTGKAGYSTPVEFEAGGKTLITLFGEDTLAGVEIDNGKVVWEIGWKANHDENIADPVIIGKQMLVSSNHGKRNSLFNIEPTGITEVWRNKNMLNWMGTSLLLKDHIYGINAREKALQCMEIKSGDKVWEADDFGQGQVMMAGDRLIAIREDGTLIIAKASPAGYKQLASAKVMKNKCWTVPVLADSRIYVRDAAGDVICIDASK